MKEKKQKPGKPNNLTSERLLRCISKKRHNNEITPLVTNIVQQEWKANQELLAHSIFLSPGSSSSIILDSISRVDMSNLRHQGIIGIWIRQQRAYRQQHLQRNIKDLQNRNNHKAQD